MEEKDSKQPTTRTNNHESKVGAMKEKPSVLALVEHVMVVAGRND